MKSLSLAIIAIAALLVSARADNGGSMSTIKFSDPSKPGTVKITVVRGSVHVHGADVAEVTIKTDAKPEHSAARKDGLRVLTVTSSFSLFEKNNVVTLDALSEGWVGGGSDFALTVPRNTNVVIANSFGGDIVCSNLTGDIDIKSLNGEVRLNDVVGGALVETTNGEISAVIRELHDKPLSFTSMNGAVVLQVPANAKANVRLRTQNGVILTDFDEKALVTTVESLPGGPGHMQGMLTSEMRRAFRDAARASAKAAHQAAEAIREATEAAREGVNGDDGPNPPNPQPRAAMPPMPPVPPIPAIPTMTGGKLVSGTLNGGGPEINVATMNGDVTLRKLESK